MEITSLSRGCD